MVLDLIFVFLLGIGAVLGVQHFLPKAPAGAATIPTTLEGFGQILSHEGQAVLKRFDDFEASFQPEQFIERMRVLMSQEFKDAFAAFQAAVAADKAAAVALAETAIQPQIDAATAAGAGAESTEDTAVVTAATAALQPTG